MADAQNPRSARYLNAFADLTKTRFVSLDNCLDALLNTGLLTLSLARASVWLFEGDGTQICCTRAVQLEGNADLGGTRIGRASCPAYFDALHSELVIDAGDANQDPRTSELRSAYLRPYAVFALLDAPVRIFGVQVGVLCLEAAEIREWQSPDRNFAAALATLCGLALEHAELLRTRAQLRRSAAFDLNTGLANAVHFSQALSLAQSAHDRRLQHGWIVRFEIIQQPTLRAALSESALRELYRQIAERLRAHLPELIDCAHAGDAEFLLWLADTYASEQAVLAALSLCFAAPIELEGQSLLLAPRCGLRRLDTLQCDPQELLRDAETALASARDGNLRVVLHSPALGAQRQQALTLEQNVRHAAQQREFCLLAQPMIELATGRLTGLEALIRWRHPQRGLLGPEHFLPVLLDTGLIVPIGRALFSQALACVAGLQHQLQRPDLGLSFNLSAPELCSPGLVELIRNELDRVAFVHGQLAVELTENAVLADETTIAGVLGELREVGCRVHLDDFGTGYSSLNHMRQLPFDAIKIDRSFLIGGLNDARDRMLIQMLVGLSHDLGRECVAEGIADEPLLRLAISLGVRIGQGFLLAEPLPFAAIDEDWLQSFEGRCAELIRGCQQPSAL